jgi:RHS repeat-associated protein
VNANDYRVLQPRLVSDPNGNQTEVAFDALGLVAGTAIMGKPLSTPLEGDTLAGFTADLSQVQLDGFFDAADPRPAMQALLQGASTRVIYDLDRFRRTRQAHPGDQTKWQPPWVATLARETHVHSALPPQGLKIQLSFSYSDGFGREIQKKIQAEPGPVVEGGPVIDPRWVGSGWAIFNNKGKPVRQFESFFNATHHFEFGMEVGVSPVLFYDPAERVIVTLHPNHTFEKIVFDPWHQTSYDMNDTCAPRNAQTGDPHTDADISGYVAAYFEALPVDPTKPWLTWHAQRSGGALGPHEQAAANRAAAHADTPTTQHFDVLGRPVLTEARNRVACAGHDLDGSEDSFLTRVELDIEGNQRSVRDAVQQAGDPLGRIVMRYDHDMLGNRIRQLSMEAGARWMLNDVTGKAIRAWDSRGHNFSTAYDALRRPIEQHVRGTTADSDPRTLNRDIQIEKIEYGESQAAAATLNLRARIYRHFDTAGLVTNARLDSGGAPVEAYDFKGNLRHKSRRLVKDYKAIPNWLLGPEPQLDREKFETSTRFDALNRPVQSVAPHSDLARSKRHVIQAAFNEANLLERVDVWLGRASEPTTLLDPATEATAPVGVAGIAYDAKGQRERIDYKNGASTFYDYDPLTFRLVHLYTRRVATFTGDCENPQPPPTIAAPDRPPQGKACGLQNLHFTYDAVGNISHIEDDAQQTIYFSNKRVEPSNDYTYDALYRLIQATGREHLGQTGGVPNPLSAHDAFDAFRTRLHHRGNGDAMGTYIERYVYDAVGNFLQMQHRGTDPAHPGWIRAYDYAETSLIETGSGGTLLKTSNRLSRTTLNPGSANPQVEPYRYDAHGNMVRMPHLGSGQSAPNMVWDCKDRLVQVERGGGKAHFVYDASGKRVRKVWEKSPGLIEERIYLAGFELFRRHSGPIGANTAALERETLHVTDDNRRIALVEMRSLDVAGSDIAPSRTIRYHCGNHLGSSALELDEQAQIVSYEEYSPYGSSTYQAVRSQTETPKRYRYTGKERDEESGLYYHRARYYAPWLGRWTSCDPAGTIDDLNVYGYVRARPVVMTDPSGRWSWGKVLGIAAAVVVGIAVTAFTGGIAGPLAAGIIGGMAAGATGEIVDAAVDGREIALRNVLASAALGGVAGGLFAGAGQLIANTGVGRAIAARVVGSGVGQAVARIAYRIATSEARAATAARAGGAVVRRGVIALEEAGEAVGRRMGGPFARNAAAQGEGRAGLAAAQADAEARATSGVQASLQGEVNERAVNATTRSGVDRSGTGLNAVETPQGRVQAPSFEQLPQPLEPLPVSGANGNTFVRGADAEIKLFGHTLLNTPRDATGQLYLGVTAPMCPSCTANLWRTRAAVPGLQIITDIPSPAKGTAGALERFIPTQPNDPPPPPPAVQLQVNF